MKRILISAYAVSPIRGSECAVGWEISHRLSKYFDVTVLMCYETPSKEKFYDEVIEFLSHHSEIQNIRFIPVKMPESSIKYTKLHDLGFWPAYYFGLKCWQQSAYQIAKELNTVEKFDLAYQLNMIGFREPGYLWKMDIPFIWGPVAGFHSIPFSYIKSFRPKEFILQSIKHFVNKAQIKLAYRARKAANKAEIVWCVDIKALKNVMSWHSKAELMQETGLNTLSGKLNDQRHYDGVRRLNLTWSGMITTGKALNILIDALLKIENFNYHLTIIGDGPLKESLVAMADPIRLNVTWTGWLNRSEVLDRMENSDLLIFTSLKEATSVTILEALGFGIPVICHDICGMAEVVNSMNGFKIPFVDYSTSVEFIVDLLKTIEANPNMLNERFKTIWSTTDSLTWDTKVNRIKQKIDEILVSNESLE